MFIAMMDAVTIFGLFAVSAMLVCYALEGRSHWYVLAFAAACTLGAAYGFLQGAWPFALLEAIWSMVALRRWFSGRRRPVPNALPIGCSRSRTAGRLMID
jgi:hypothetical protein